MTVAPSIDTTQKPYRAEATFHGNWVSDEGQRMCDGCYAVEHEGQHFGRKAGRILCATCFQRGPRKSNATVR